MLDLLASCASIGTKVYDEMIVQEIMIFCGFLYVNKYAESSNPIKLKLNLKLERREKEASSVQRLQGHT